MKRVNIFGDGDCVLNAALLHVNSFSDSRSLHKALCEHIEENMES